MRKCSPVALVPMKWKHPPRLEGDSGWITPGPWREREQSWKHPHRLQWDSRPHRPPADVPAQQLESPLASQPIFSYS
jgi:hypothetical protein